MQRICFVLQVKPERLLEYKERHRSVWPDMITALRETGWNNYSLFLRPTVFWSDIWKPATSNLPAPAWPAAMSMSDGNVKWQTFSFSRTVPYRTEL